MSRHKIVRAGSAVRALRGALALTQTEFAVRLMNEGAGVEPQTVSRWERSHVPELEWRGLLATLGLPLGWKPGDAVPRAESGSPGDPTAPAEASDD